MKYLRSKSGNFSLSCFPQQLKKMLILTVCCKTETHSISSKIGIEGTETTMYIITVCNRAERFEVYVETERWNIQYTPRNEIILPLTSPGGFLAE